MHRIGRLMRMMSMLLAAVMLVTTVPADTVLAEEQKTDVVQDVEAPGDKTEPGQEIEAENDNAAQKVDDMSDMSYEDIISGESLNEIVLADEINEDEAVANDEITGAANTSGTAGKDGKLTWTYDENTKTLTIAGRAPDTSKNQTDDAVADELPNETDVSALKPIYDAHVIQRIKFNNVKLKGSAERLFCFGNSNTVSEIDLSGLDTSRVTSMKAMFYQCSSVESLDLSKLNTSNVTDMSYMFSECNALKTVDLRGLDTSNVVNIEQMFYRCNSLEGTLDVSSFDMKKAQNTYGMFFSCADVTQIKFGTDFTPSESKSMGEMFRDCHSLTSLDLSTFDTGKCEGFNSMFKGCYSLGSLNLSSFDTSKSVTNFRSMESMFEGCTELKSINFGSNFTTKETTTYKSMFKGCEKLTSLDVSMFNTKLDTTGSSVSMQSMFDGCNSLSLLDLSNFDMSDVKNADNMFGTMRSLVTLKTPKKVTINIDLPKKASGAVKNWKDSSGTPYTTLTNNLDAGIELSSITAGSGNLGTYKKLTYSFDANTATLTITGTAPVAGETAEDVADVLVPRDYNNGGLYGLYEELTPRKIKFVNCYLRGNSSKLFYRFENIEEIDLNGLDVSLVTNFKDMFNGCKKITSLDLSGFDTSSATDMTAMFSACSSLTGTLDVSSFDTSNVTDMSNMFSNCSKVTEIRVGSKFDTSKVTKMDGMFAQCADATSLPVSGFNTSKVKDMRGMFTYCSGVRSLDLSSFDVSNVTNFGDMFSDCRALEAITGRMVTSSAESMSFMFRFCNKLRTVDISGFNTQKVYTMANMFEGCESLSSLDVSHFDTKNCQYTNSMFDDCKKLKNITFGENFTTEKVTTMNRMFHDCQLLKTLDLSTFHTSAVTDMGYMFEQCYSLSQLNLGDNFDTGSVNAMYDMNGMFRGCRSLETLNLGNKFNTSNVRSMYAMFYGCGSLKSLDLGSRFATSNVTDMTSMFRDLYSLTSLRLGSNFNTSKVTSMLDMFSGCKKLGTLDLSYFDMSLITSNSSGYLDMFFDCRALTTLKTPQNIKIDIKLPGGYVNNEFKTGTWKNGEEVLTGNIPKTTSSIVLTRNDPLPADPEYVPPTVPDDPDDPVTPDAPVTPSDPTEKYTVTISGGGENATIAGSTVSTVSCVAGATVRIYAGEKDTKVFTGWTSSPSVAFLNPKSKQTSFTMPKDNVTITANWKDESAVVNPTGDTGKDVSGEPIADKPENYVTVSEANSKDISKCTIPDLPAKVYTGKPITPKVKVKDGRKTLKEGTDYRLTYLNNTNVGKAFVFVSGVGEYSKSIPIRFDIKGKPLNKLKVVTDNVPVGPVKTYPIHIFDGQYELVNGQDYTYTFDEAVKGTNNKVTISPVDGSNYSKGSKDLVVKVTGIAINSSKGEKLITEDCITLAPKSAEASKWTGTGGALSTVYDGTSKVPDVTVTVDGTTLRKGTDFTVSFKNNKNAGTAYAIVKGKGKTYKGQAVKSFTIETNTAVTFSSVIVNKNRDLTFNGKVQKPSVVIKIKDAKGKEKKLANNKDYTLSYQCNVNSGHGYVTVTGLGNYDGIERTYVFKILPKDIKKVTKKIKNASAITLKFAGKTLEQGTEDGDQKDYTVKVEDSAAAGKKKVTITGHGNYTGTFEKDKVKAQ